MLAEKKSRTIYFLKQKLCGAALICVGILIPVVNDGDATVSLLVVPLGIALLFSKQRLMLFK